MNIQKVIQITLLIGMVQVGYGMEIAGPRQASLPSAEQCLKGIVIDNLPESDLNHLFLHYCQVNAPVIKHATELVSRAVTRERRLRVMTVRSSTDSLEGDITARDEENTPISCDAEVFGDQLEEIVPAIEKPLPSLKHDFLPDHKRQALRAIQSVHIYNSTHTRLDSLSSDIAKTYEVFKNSDYFSKALMAGALATVMVGSYKTLPSARGMFGDSGGSLLSTLIQFAGGTIITGLVAYKVYDTWSDMLAAMQALEHLKKDITNWKKEMSAIKTEFKQLDENTKKLDQAMLQVLQASDTIQQQMPDVVALSSDHSTMAGIMQDMIKQMKHDQAKLIKLNECLAALAAYGNLSSEAKMVLQNNTDIVERITTVDPFQPSPLSEEEQREKIMDKYNKSGLLGKIMGKKPACFDDIPREWFEKHKEWLKKKGYTVRPSSLK